MKRNWTRGLAFALAMAMAVCCWPGVALAREEQEVTYTEIPLSNRFVEMEISDVHDMGDGTFVAFGTTDAEGSVSSSGVQYHKTVSILRAGFDGTVKDYYTFDAQAAFGRVGIEMVRLVSDGYLIVGYAVDYGTPFIMKVGLDNLPKWMNTLDHYEYQQYRDVAEVNGELIAVGYARQQGSTERRAMMARINKATGVTIESAIYDDKETFFRITPSGLGWLFTREMEYFINYAAAGTPTMYGYKSNCESGRILDVADGVMVISNGLNEGDVESAVVFKLDKNGKKIWERSIKGSKDTALTNIYELNGNYVTIGYSYATDGDLQGVITEGDGKSHFFTFVYDKNGSIVKKAYHDWSGVDFYIVRMMSHNGSVYALGNKEGNKKPILAKINFKTVSTDPEPTPTGGGAATPAPKPTPSQPTQPEAKSGWKQENGSWYYYENNAAAKGWKKIGGSWYLLDKSTGAMKTGWVNEGGWYYMKPSGKMATGWEKIGGSWYNLGTNGKMKTGWVQSGSRWYYMKSSGKMAANEWQKVGSAWYWFDGSGVMATGTRTIGGKTYRFSASGVWIR